MDVAMSSSVAITSPSLLFNPHVNSTPSSPPPSNSMSTARELEHGPEHQEHSQQPQLPPSTLPVEMDLSTSVPSLPAGAVLEPPPDADADAPMLDVEAAPNGPLPNGESVVVNGEQQHQWSSANGSATPSGHSASQQTTTGDQAPLAISQLETTGTQESPSEPNAASGSQPAAASESMNHSTQLGGPANNLQEPPAIVNGTTENPGDAMDTTQSETSAPAPPAEMSSHEGILREWVNAALGMPDGSALSVSTPPAAPMITERSTSEAPPAGAPPPPEGEVVPPEDDGGSDTPSDSDDDDTPAPSDFAEDTTVPDEEECKGIEAGSERSGTDHQYFEKIFFPDLDDPEYVPGEIGRIEWTVTGVRGTWERPNKEALMKSPAVRIGELDWNIKFYPKGNQTDYASVYLEASMPSPSSSSSTPASEASQDAASMDPPSTAHPPPSEDVPQDVNPTTPVRAETQPSSQTASAVSESQSQPQSLSQVDPPPVPPEEPVDSQMSEVIEPPSADQAMPTLSQPERKEWSVPAQFGVVVYNPNEPRVLYSQGMHHRFGTNAPDWGWTRFCGPHNQLHKRRRGQRQALLRNDTLAFTAYIRIVHDDTQVLWDPDPFGLTWDSLAKTGMRALKPKGPDESFIVAAISSWALLAPFRRIINAIPTGDPLRERHEQPKVLTIALQRVLHRMVAQQKPSPSPVSLDPINDFLSAIGSHPTLLNDVVDLWELLRLRLDEELKGTSGEDQLQDLFDGLLQRREGDQTDETGSDDPDQDVLATGKPPCLRLPGRGVPNIQAAFAKAFDYIGQRPRATIQKPPKFLQAELSRQWFDESCRTWKRSTDKIEIDEHIDLGPWMADGSMEAHYTLYGLIVHRGSLRTKNFQSVLRPGGPGTRWYTQAYGASSVVCQTRKQAIEKHEGTSSADGDDSDAVAYVVMYVRDDVVKEVLQGLPGESESPQWIKAELEREQAAYTWLEPDDLRRADTKRSIDLRIFRPELFMESSYTGLGVFDIYAASAETLQSDHIIDLTMEGSATVADVQKKVEEMLKIDPTRGRCQLYRFDVLAGILGRAAATPLPTNTLASETVDWPQMQYWLHHVAAPKNNDDGASGDVSGSAAATESNPPAAAASVTWDDASAEPPIVEESVDTGHAERPSQSSAADEEAADDPSTPTPEASQRTTQSEEADPDAHAAEDAPMPDVSEAGSVTPEDDDPEPDPAGDEMDIEPPPPADAYPDAYPGIPVEELVRIRRVGRRMARRLVASRPPTTTIHDPNTFFFFVKRFDARKECLAGSHISHLSAPMITVGEFMRGLFDFPEDRRIRVWEEVNPDRVREVILSRTFSEERLETGAILIVEEVLSDGEASELEEQGHLVSVSRFVQSCADRMQSVFPADDEIEYHYFLGRYFKGTRKYGNPHGHGKMIELSGDVYEGDFVLGKRQGQGRMVFQNGDVYEGGWHDGRMHGEGTLVYGKTGNTYVGGFRHGRRHGRGRMEYAMAEDELKLCQICYEEDIDALFYDCGHVCACQTCAKQLEDCPICRKPVINVVKMFWT